MNFETFNNRCEICDKYFEYLEKHHIKSKSKRRYKSSFEFN